MLIDFLTLVMINLVAGTVLLAYYLWKGLDAEDQKPYAELCQLGSCNDGTIRRMAQKSVVKKYPTADKK